MNEPNIALPPLLEVKDLRVSFGGKEVVHGVDFAKDGYGVFPSGPDFDGLDRLAVALA